MGQKPTLQLSSMMLMFIVLTLAFVPASKHVELVLPALAEDSFSVVVESADKPDPTLEGKESSDFVFHMEIIRDAAPPTLYAGKKVLIYHTHTYEAYEQTESSQYKQTEKWRTIDSDHNVIAVGKALTATLRTLGLEVVHDTTAFEPPTLDNAYERSLAMLEERRARGEHYDLYIDLHRDAIASSSTIKRTVNIGGEEIARFMVVVGKGTTGGYVEKPDWEKNLTIAQQITDSLNSQCSNLARDVKIKTGRFNQHIANCCVLIECGMNINTLDEALAGVPYLAEAIASALNN